MNGNDYLWAAVIAVTVYALAVKLARNQAHQVTAGAGFVPTGFSWSFADQAYVRVGADGTRYTYA